ncbi:hypothetical protein QTH91_01070 [Variovorax dokdonensis]|uniref:ABC transporter permease n=1 Tax=Variovorax dokdonensis TaxID=344883 RepID=A0ABT7N543_9BURK|nr:hypothetical protein [Variovorax dokdonensis]MDM0043061.1 hypothetical protein [Variovorax dokdonensis]
MNLDRPELTTDSRMPVRIKAEGLLSAICAALAVLTWFVPDWIERWFEVSPDQGSGEAEWGIVLAFAIAALVTGWMARRDWRRWVQRRGLEARPTGSG